MTTATARPGWLAWGALAALACGSVVSGCSTSSTAPTPPTQSKFVLAPTPEAQSGLTFFDHPWPSDVRRDAAGAPDFRGYPNPFLVPLLAQYIDATTGLFEGFSPAAPVYLRFTAPIDPSTLPADAPAATAPGATVQLVDVDPASPDRGKRQLVTLRYQRDEGTYWPSSTLAVAPLFGQPLRPKTRYAVVVTRGVRGDRNLPIEPSVELQEVLGLRPATPASEKVRAAFAPALTELAAAGVAAADIAHMTVFTTDDPTRETYAIADHVRAKVPAPTASAWTAKDENADFDVYEGTYGPSPNYQSGTLPFAKPVDGGKFVFEGGEPKLQGTFDLRFALAVPKAAACPVPPGGYPVVLYAHGTGGDYRSFIDDRTAQALAKECMASMGVDQIFHGTRPGSPPESDPQREGTIQLLFFNFDNPLAARCNTRQSAIDVVQQARLFTESKAVVPAAVSRTQANIAFDPARVMFFGHSQGGLNGPVFLAADGSVRGGVLSGAGAVLAITLVEKTKPQPSVAGAVKTLLQLNDPERAAEFDAFHPILALAQSLLDVSDTVHYARNITTSPRGAGAPKSVFMTEGVDSDGTGDNYTPPHGIEALALAIGLPRVAPGTKPFKEAAWAGLPDVTIPAEGLSGNLAGGRASGVLAQFAPKAGSDGHFVVFNVPAARTMAARFLRNLADDPVGRVPAP